MPPGPLRTSLTALRHRLLLPLMLRKGSLPALLEKLEAEARPGGVAGPRGEVVERLVGRMMRPLSFWRTTCLWRSLAGYSALRAAGQEVRFVIGVRLDERGELAAHAWLERDGRPSIGAPGPEDGFSVAFAWPADSATLTAPMERPQNAIRTSAEAILTELKDGTGVVLHLGSKQYFTLNGSGVVAWKALADGSAVTQEALAELLHSRFPAAGADQIRADVSALLAELASEGLIELPT
ncbi:MAG: lasso peptide biosynthesis B2 protein [Anaeromyxobacter sp.]|nr:lasso peptide biosynthesis B2 protein [Anaeromyxobacter sp.]MBL0278066.1 lasso peptide biosynthesis B2 protein [Anaeromyxobacter sp.]